MMKSLMFVPAKPKMLAKIPSFEADGFILDLEDSIAEPDKAQALDGVCAFLSERDGHDIFVRIARNHADEELSRLRPFSFLGYMFPKVESAAEVESLATMSGGKEIIALVETPMALVNIREIAACPSVSRLAFGAEDFTSAAGMKNAPDSLLFAKSTIAIHAKAFGKPVYDTPSFILDDLDALSREIQTAVDLGFDGKMAIHPKQVPLINEGFRYFDLDHIRSVVAQYEAAGQAVLRLGDHVYEKMHIAHYKRILKEHETH